MLPLDAAGSFEPHRRHLLSVAYRFLGSVADADRHGVTQTLAFEIHDGLVTALYQTRNPEKLRHIPAPPVIAS